MIAPALTPEEWERPLSYLATKNSEAYRGLETTRQDAHARAALALYGQPFGFTREDVKLLREVASIAYSVFADDLDLGDGKAADSLADRIEALLPPEDA